MIDPVLMVAIQTTDTLRDWSKEILTHLENDLRMADLVAVQADSIGANAIHNELLIRGEKDLARSLFFQVQEFVSTGVSSSQYEDFCEAVLKDAAEDDWRNDLRDLLS